ncbi:T9SS type A sorting domain-containing protein [Taibaiella chishuiensis]|uniref:Putative secreted protein (Por secretion system target) n=1 Tax=Taibaiella chishuiensis TaxID=1434707 RepID=A0A2P8CX62_9BACT|nr:T9SS type A sorting domain-containing protein [Taibaiella chishuiensis]PSK89517.1 putative secreted protein (Por secretion system target) [Taibaiella chishuiensis]
MLRRTLLYNGLFASLLYGHVAQAQNPGGVPVSAWYRADATGMLFSDAGTTAATDNTTVYQWNEFTGTGFNLLQAVAGSRPTFSNAATLANFNPTVTFNADFMAFQPATGVNIIDRASGHLYAAGYMNQLTGCGFLGFDASMDYPGLHTSNNGLYNLLFFTGGPGYQGLSTNSFTAGSYFSAGAGWLNGAGATAAYAAATVSLNGTRTDYSGNQLQNAVVNNNSRDIRVGGDTNWGSLNGQLNEMMVFENKLTVDEMDRVESYMAIKYGTTYAGGTRDYKNAASGVTWSATTNAGYHYNIAGIGRDNAGNLHQKQSRSGNTGQQVVISTTGLQHANAGNTQSLTDGQFLVWGDNGQAKKPTVAITGIPGINYRFASVWKVQNTGSVGTVRVAWPKQYAALKLIQSTDATIDATDVVTDMTSTTTVIDNGEPYVYADVTLTNGQYFTLAAYVQAPGGVVGGLMMWHKADDGTATAGPKNLWQDLSGNGHTVSQDNNAAYRPNLVTDATYAADSKNYGFNFNPFYYFNGTNQFFYRDNDSYFPSDTSAGTAYGVMHNSAATGYRTAFGWGDDDPNLVRAGDNYQVWRDNGLPLDQNVGAGNLPVHIAGMAWKGSGTANNGIYLNLNGRVYNTTAYNIGTLNNANNFAIGSEGFGLTGNGNEVFQGGISEVFAYSTDLQNATGTEKQRINSYLAVKYGITLSNDAGTGTADYLSSNAVNVWNATQNNGFAQNIAGIAYDYSSGLNQKQSRSVNTGKQVLIGTTGLANANDLNTVGLLNDGQYLVWGDNGQSKSPGVLIDGLNGVNYRFKSIWKVQNTGSVGAVRVAWPAGLNNLSLLQSADSVFNASDVLTGMTTNTTTINGTVYNYADVTLANGQYFTFAAYVAHAPGGVANGLSHWYRADMNVTATGDGTSVTAWTDYASGVTASQIATANLPVFRAGAANYFNFNPGINFTAADQKIGNITVGTLNSLDFDIFTLTKEGMSGGRYFNVGMNNTTLNGTNWDAPGLYGNGAIARRDNGGSLLFNSGTVPAVASNVSSISYNNFHDQSFSKGVNGSATGTVYTHAAIGEVTGGHIFGANTGAGTSGDDGGIVGSVGEVIIYGNGNITAEERNRVDAYLAIKYGVTLDTSRHYLSSKAAIVWDKQADSAYYHNVAGIGRDTISALYQKQSSSQHTNTNNQVAMGLGSLYATNAANTGTLADGQFMLWGDNGSVSAMTNNAATYTTFSYNGNAANRRMKRVWKVRNSGVGQTVKLRFPVASVGTTTLAAEDGCTQYAIIYASDENFTSGLVVAPLTVNGTDYEALNNFPQGASYFTFAKLAGVEPGLVTLPATTTTVPNFSTCSTNSWRYAKQTAGSNKYLAISGMTTVQLGNLGVTITPTGAQYNNNGRQTRLMPRVTTITDASNGNYTGVKVRVYYSAAEKAATQISNAQTNGWFKYQGNAATIAGDINTNGVFTGGAAMQVIPDASGTEDGVAYVDFYNVSSFSSFVFVSSTEPAGVVLPVTLTSFTAKVQGSQVVLDWLTASEHNNRGFAVERSADSKQWTAIGFVTSRAPGGNSATALAYQHADLQPLKGQSYYRLKQTDNDGRYVYSNIRQVVTGNGAAIQILPNPARDFVTVSGLDGTETIHILDASGRKIKESQVSGTTATLQLSGMPQGLYHIRVIAPGGAVVSRKVIKL